MSTPAELNPLFGSTSDMASPLGPSADAGGASRQRPRALFHRESTRLRSNVADQVQRDLLPAGRMLSVFLVFCELLAEVAVLFATRSQACDRPLRFWVLVLMCLQSATVFLNCLNIWSAGDAFSPHRAGLSASDPDMYDGAALAAFSPPGSVAIPLASDGGATPPPPQPSPPGLRTAFLPGARDARRTEFVDRYVRVVNAVYLVWYIVGSVWVSGRGTCHATAPHLYRLAVALTIIYYALLFLPLACFCLIVCCLPLFILVYRIMLPYAERERRRARAADPALVQSLSTVPYSPTSFQSLTGSDNLEDASCVICLCDYEPGEQVRFLPCKHHFHRSCIDEWLQLDKACCLCKQDIDAQAGAAATAV